MKFIAKTGNIIFSTFILLILEPDSDKEDNEYADHGVENTKVRSQTRKEKMEEKKFDQKSSALSELKAKRQEKERKDAERHKKQAAKEEKKKKDRSSSSSSSAGSGSERSRRSSSSSARSASTDGMFFYHLNTYLSDYIRISTNNLCRMQN